MGSLLCPCPALSRPTLQEGPTRTSAPYPALRHLLRGRHLARPAIPSILTQTVSETHPLGEWAGRYLLSKGDHSGPLQQRLESTRPSCYPGQVLPPLGLDQGQKRVLRAPKHSLQMEKGAYPGSPALGMPSLQTNPDTLGSEFPRPKGTVK